MTQTIFPQNISITEKAPSSKSAAQRAIAISTLISEPVKIYNNTFSDDILSAVRVSKGLGKKITINNNVIKTEQSAKPKKKVLNCGESGLCIRMFSPVAAILTDSFSMIGEGSLSKRPVSMISDALKKSGLISISNKGLPPIHISGKLKGGEITIDGSLSSQILTGLLIALPCVENDSKIFVNNLKSKPYIDLTIEIMKHFGVEIINENYEVFTIRGNQKYKAKDYTTEGDWSGASFLLVAGAIAGNANVSNLKLNSKQADKEIINVLKNAGAIIKINKNSVTVEKSDLSAFEFDAAHCPDLFPPLVSLAFNCKGTSVIKGVSRLKHKESNRAEVLKKEYKKLGGNIIIEGDYMKIEGKKLNGGIVNSNNDHRIAMSLAVSGLNSFNEITIENSNCINKSYPGFFESLLKN